MFEYIEKIIDTNNKIIQNLKKNDSSKYYLKINELVNKNKQIMEIWKNEAKGNN